MTSFFACGAKTVGFIDKSSAACGGLTIFPLCQRLISGGGDISGFSGDDGSVIFVRRVDAEVLLEALSAQGKVL